MLEVDGAIVIVVGYVLRTIGVYLIEDDLGGCVANLHVQVPALESGTELIQAQG